MKNGKMVIYDDLQQELILSESTLDIHKLLIMSNYIECITRGKCIGRLKNDYKGVKVNTQILIDYRKIIEFYVLSIFEIDSVAGTFDSKDTIVSRNVDYLKEYIEMIPFKDDKHFLSIEKGTKVDPKLFSGINLIK